MAQRGARRGEQKTADEAAAERRPAEERRAERERAQERDERQAERREGERDPLTDPTDEEVAARSSAEQAAAASERMEDEEPERRASAAEAEELAHQAAERAGVPGDQGADAAGRARVLHEDQALAHGQPPAGEGYGKEGSRVQRGTIRQDPGEEFTVLTSIVRGEPGGDRVVTLLPGDPISFQEHEHAHVMDLLESRHIVRGAPDSEEAQRALGEMDLARGEALRHSGL